LIPDRQTLLPEIQKALFGCSWQPAQIQPPEYKREIAAGWLVPVDKGSRSRGGLSLFLREGGGLTPVRGGWTQRG
jgi:hypothetical protein